MRCLLLHNLLIFSIDFCLCSLFLLCMSFHLRSEWQWLPPVFAMLPQPMLHDGWFVLDELLVGGDPIFSSYLVHAFVMLTSLCVTRTAVVSIAPVCVLFMATDVGRVVGVDVAVQAWPLKSDQADNRLRRCRWCCSTTSISPPVVHWAYTGRGVKQAVGAGSNPFSKILRVSWQCCQSNNTNLILRLVVNVTYTRDNYLKNRSSVSPNKMQLVNNKQTHPKCRH